MRTHSIVAGLLALLLTASVVHAQDPEPTPRDADGRPYLGSAPDFPGYWEIRPGGGGGIGFPPNRDLPLKPWTRALMEYRDSLEGVYPPSVECKPTGGPGFFPSPGFDVVHDPVSEKIFILNIAGPHSWRVIYMDGREHPEDLRPTYLGHSIGSWEDETLVIDTVGFNEKTWIRGSIPTTDRLHLIERITRPNLRTIRYEVTFEDPGAFTDTWSGGWEINTETGSSWIDGGEMFEYICQDSRL